MEFQSTLPRGERLDKRSYKKEFQHISIHAPTRGATLRRREQTKQIRDFNPRSHEGSDLHRQLLIFSRRYFNPRSHEGSDFSTAILAHLAENFNPRSHEGSDNKMATLLVPYRISIHAPTRGATDSSGYHNTQNLISIHAPTRGATLLLAQQLPQGSDFNPRSHEGSDAVKTILWVYTSTFQSTLPRGERRNKPLHLYVIKNFNPRSHEGSDLLC